MRTKRLIPIIIAVTVVLFFAIVIVVADVTTTYTVYPGNMQDWQTQTAPGAQPTPAATPYVSFVNGPATPPLGSGSAELGVGSDGGAVAQLRQPDYAGTVLPNPDSSAFPAGNELTELRYSTYVQVGGSASQAPYIILDVDYDNNGTVDDHLVFEPQYQIAGFCPSNPQGPVATGVWQTWDAFNGCWYSTSGVAGSGPGANVKLLRDISSAQPNAQIVNSGSNGGVRIVAGLGGVIGGGSASDWANFIGNVDDFRIGVNFDPDNGPIVTEYDFEPAPPPPPPSVDVGVTKTANSDEVLIGNNVTYTIQVVSSGNAANVVLNDTLPGTMTFVSLSSPGGWTCSTPAVGGGGSIACTNPNLAATSGDIFTLVANVPNATQPNTFFDNTATVSTTSTDVNPENDSSDVGVTAVSCFSNPVVTTNADSGPGSLRQAIADACDGSTIGFDMSQVASPITLTSGELLINKNLTIQGPGANLLTIQRSTAANTPVFRVFEISNNANVNISGVTVSHGSLDSTVVNSDGCGILINGASLTLKASAVTSNQCLNLNDGGGISVGNINDLSSTLNLLDSTISGNSANSGGGIYARHATISIVNSTISGNTANAAGGGISNYSNTSTLNITNATVASNTALQSGSPSGVDGSATVKNSIIAANINNASHPDVGNGTFTSQGYNLIGNPGTITSFNQSGDRTGTSAAPLDPHLSPLQNNGGTTETMIPLPGSPAINAGNPSNLPLDTFDLDNDGNTDEPLPVDQRGFQRVVGSGFDIGAVEVQAGTPDHLVFSVQPSNTNAGAIITPAVQVEILDVTNSLVTTSNANVSVAIGTNPAGGTLSGTTTVAAVNGVATFSNLSINNGGSGYTLTASSNGLVGATSNPFNVNGPPTITAVGVTRTAGSPSANSTIANVNDAEDAKNTLAVTVNNGSSATVNSVTVSNLSVSSAGVVTADVVAVCGATTANFTLTVTDSGGLSSTAMLTVTVNSNPAPTLSYSSPQSVNVGSSLVINPATGPSDNGSVNSIVVQSKGTYTGTISVNNTTGVVSISNAAPAGTHTITIRATDNCGATTDATFTLQVNKINQTITVNQHAPSSATYNSTFTVAATSDSGLPVTYSSAGSCTNNGATFTMTSGTGTCTVKYDQPGDTNYNAATEVTETVTAQKAATTTTVISSVNPSDFGQSVTFTATITSSAGTPSGATVQFKDNGNNLGLPVTVVNGVATLTTSSLTVGTHTITADYSGDANFLSSSGTLAGGQTVKPQPTLSINDVSVTEVSSGSTNAVFTVTLSAASNLTVTVNYATADGTAKAGTDYQSTTGTLTFNPQDTQQTITVPIIGHTLNGTSATFTVNLSNPTNATISKAQGVGTIQSQTTSMQFSATSYTVNEGDGHAVVTINRLGDISQPASVNYATSDLSGLNPCSQVTGLASQRCDYAISIGKLNFAAGESSKNIFIPIIDDAFVEGPEVFTITISNPVGGALQGTNSAQITITDNDVAGEPNPLDQDSFFVREMYIDFLDREPDPMGLQCWLNILHGVNAPPCPPPPPLPPDHDRIAVALGFVNSAEFQDRGYFIYKLYKTLPDSSNPTFGRIPHYFEFSADMAKVSGFLTNQDLNAAKDAFIAEFMARTEFMNKYNPTLNDPTSYVDALLATVNLPNHPTRNTWIAGLTNGTLTRGQVLRQLVESAEVDSRFKNEAFIIMNYFGFLRRDADAAYINWIQLFNDTNDQRLIINGFINSAEYRQRFAP